MSFESLGLSAPVLQAVADKGYTEPTPIQEKAIPIVLMGRDVLGCAQTGTGKTASFVLPMIDILSEGRAKARMPRSLILEPTRELAAQVAGELRDLRQEPQAQHGAADRRRELPRPGTSPRARRRRADRHPGPPARPHRARRHPAERRQDPGDRRSRPHARHGLHPRRRAHREPAAAASPDAVLLGHHAAGDQAAGRSLPQQPQGSHCLAAGLGRHEHRAGPGRGAGRRQARGAARADQEPGDEERPGVLQPQARRGAAAHLAEEGRLQRRRAARRHEPAGAHRDARALQGRRDPDPGGVRRRRARPRHRRHEPRLQFRRAVLAGRLRPSHRPHRPRRPDRPFLHPGVALRGRPRAGDREADRHDHSPHRDSRPRSPELRGVRRPPSRPWPRPRWSKRRRPWRRRAFARSASRAA